MPPALSPSPTPSPPSPPPTKPEPPSDKEGDVGVAIIPSGTPHPMSHFFNHRRNDPLYALEELQCHYCQFSSWASHAKYPISIINDTGDGALLPASFTFIERSIKREGVEEGGEEWKSGCECVGAEGCTEKGCLCLEDVEGEGPGRRINAYHRTTFGGVGRRWTLRSEMLESRRPVYECHEKCRCGEECANRVVQRGRRVGLSIFRTMDGRGWGVRARDDLIKGQFVDLYVGEILTSTEATRRRTTASSSSQKDIYLFALDKFTSPTSADPRLRGEPYEVDGEYFSGPTRFINHSCDPNLRIMAVVPDSSNRHLHLLGFFAVKDIERETELTFDYTDGVREDDGDGEEGIEEMVRGGRTEGLTRCLCGAKGCRGWLW